MCNNLTRAALTAKVNVIILITGGDILKSKAVTSCVKPLSGIPTLFVNGEPFTSVAYMTYLEKFNKYDEFTKAGYNFFSVPVLFSGRWISITDGFTPFKKGIFDKKGKPDFSVYDETINKILEVCPNAYIIPRVNLNMPLWWEEENPESVNIRPDGSSCRESFYSDKWFDDVSHMLREFISYSENCEFSRNIIGYQIAGGNTEEWFHFDLNAGYCKNAEKGFEHYLNENYPLTKFKGLPSLAKLKSKGTLHGDSYLALFLEYASVAVADSIAKLAAIVKGETENRVVVGTFYGYTLEVSSAIHGTHALNRILQSPDIDFICSPNSYFDTRGIFSDWTEMYPADSVRLHGKMCFQECDIRTHLTVLLHDKDPETDPHGILSNKIWLGPESKETALSMIRKSFSRQLIKGNGLWWFDMWGGWYSDTDVMNDMEEYRKIYESGLKSEKRCSNAELAVFIDESAFKLMTDCETRNAAYIQRHELGLVGAPYDMYDVFDFEAVYRKYKAVIFLSGVNTPLMEKALGLCEKYGIPFIGYSENKVHFTLEELTGFCKENNVFQYCQSGDIIYVNDNFLFILAESDGEKTINLPYLRRITDCCGKCLIKNRCDSIKITMSRGESRLFRLEEAY